MTNPQPGLKTYNGSCHCGVFEFSVQIPEIKNIVQCNCSFCFKRGYEWAYPVQHPFVVEKDEGTLVGYEFGVRSMVHKV
jgi:hypothetical protein